MFLTKSPVRKLSASVSTKGSPSSSSKECSSNTPARHPPLAGSETREELQQMLATFRFPPREGAPDDLNERAFPCLDDDLSPGDVPCSPGDSGFYIPNVCCAVQCMPTYKRGFSLRVERLDQTWRSPRTLTNAPSAGSRQAFEIVRSPKQHLVPEAPIHDTVYDAPSLMEDPPTQGSERCPLHWGNH